LCGCCHRQYIRGQNHHAPPAVSTKKRIYFENDYILRIRVSEMPIEREAPQGWHTNISYAEDEWIVGIGL
jgi:hypothetical protein